MKWCKAIIIWVKRSANIGLIICDGDCYLMINSLLSRWYTAADISQCTATTSATTTTTAVSTTATTTGNKMDHN